MAKKIAEVPPDYELHTGNPSQFPRISIVTPSYNQGAFLEQCIESVLSQNYPNLEYVVMDGGSTDNSVAIIRKYEKYLAYWQSVPDGGQFAAVNAGFRHTAGEIMAWLNSDDMYHPQAFFRAACVLSRHPHIEWLTARHSFWTAGGDMQGLVYGPLPRFCRRSHLQHEYLEICIQQESTFWRRSLWDKAGGALRQELNYAGDLELWTRFYRHAPLYVLDHFLGGYRKHGDQKMSLFPERYFKEAESIINAECKLVRQRKHADMYDAPEPVYLSYEELAAYMSRDEGLSRTLDHGFESAQKYVTYIVETARASQPTRLRRAARRAKKWVLRFLVMIGMERFIPFICRLRARLRLWKT